MAAVEQGLLKSKRHAPCLGSHELTTVHHVPLPLYHCHGRSNCCSTWSIVASAMLPRPAEQAHDADHPGCSPIAVATAAVAIAAAGWAAAGPVVGRHQLPSHAARVAVGGRGGAAQPLAPGLQAAYKYVRCGML